MFPERATSQLPDVPLGAILLPNLLRRYLRAVGNRLFKPGLTDSEIDQFAVLAFFKVMKKYATADLDENEVWDRILLGDPVDNFWVLPDTTEGRAFHSSSTNLTVLLKGRTHVVATLRRAFINLIQAELRPAKHQTEIVQALNGVNSSARRRRQPVKIKDGLPGKSGYQSLEQPAIFASEQRLNAEARAVLETVLGELHPDHVMVLELFVVFRYKAKEVAKIMEMSEANVRKIISKFHEAVKKERLKTNAPG